MAKGKLVTPTARVYRNGPKTKSFFNPAPEHVNDEYYQDFDGDAQANMAQGLEENPPKPDPVAGPLRPQRKAAADATHFFRRFSDSKLRDVICKLSADGEGRSALLQMAIQALGKGLPDKETMDKAAELLAQAMEGFKPGDKFDPEAFANLVGASKYLSQVPESLTYLVRRSGKPIIIPSDEPEFNCKLGEANILDLPREMFWMDDELFYEAYSRNALTKFEWDKRIWEPTHVKVTFIVDVSGSMNGPPILIATACALKLSKVAKANGHEVSVVFFATHVSKEYTPEEAFGLKGLEQLGGGTDIEGAIRKVYDSKPDAYVICSDFQVTPPTPESTQMLKGSQVFGMLPGPSQRFIDAGKKQLDLWIPEAHRRLIVRTKREV